MLDPWLRPRSESTRLGEPSVVLDTVVQAVFTTIVAFALYLLFAGHNQPGGGFIAGLVVGAGLALRLVTGRSGLARSRITVSPEAMAGTGVLLVMATALVPVVVGGTVLEHHTWEYDVAVLGTVKWTSALYFDTGIMLVVVGVLRGLLATLGDEVDR